MEVQGSLVTSSWWSWDSCPDPPAAEIWGCYQLAIPRATLCSCFSELISRPFGSEEMPSSLHVSKECWLLLRSLLFAGPRFPFREQLRVGVRVFFMLLESTLQCRTTLKSPGMGIVLQFGFQGGCRFFFLLIILILFQRGSERQTIPLRTSA